MALQCDAVRHSYGTGSRRSWVLDGVDLRVRSGECGVLCGPSGSGKTTLLSIAGCLLTPSEGAIRIAGEAVRGVPEELNRLRREKIGFVFQHAQLLPFLNVRENLEVVGWSAGLAPDESGRRIDDLLARLEMREHAGKAASVLSGGQRQRVAVARALIGKPTIILADEPTAALGWDIGQVVVDLLVRHAREEGCGLLVVTHDTRLLPVFDRVFEMQNGRINEETINKE